MNSEGIFETDSGPPFPGFDLLPAIATSFPESA